MEVYIAIDLLDGEISRLTKGDFTKAKKYNIKIKTLLKDLNNYKISHLHIVDLDGAKNGNCINYEIIKKIREEYNGFIQVGGGIRNENTVELYLDKLKVDRVILGTKAITDKHFVKKMIEKYGVNKIAVSLDVKDGYTYYKGWLEKSNENINIVLSDLLEIGVKNFILTDISKDGMTQGIDSKMYNKIRKKFLDINIILAGGITTIEDLNNISKLQLNGGIIGKAFYEGLLTLEEVKQWEN